MKRRDFIKTAGAATLVCACGLSVNSCSMFSGVSSTPELPPESFSLDNNTVTIDIKKAIELEKVGYSAKLKFGPEYKETKMIIAHVSDEQYLCYENKCTHGGREIEYMPQEKAFQCVSFGHSSFSIDGKVTGGPAKGPLKQFNISKVGNELIIALV